MNENDALQNPISEVLCEETPTEEILPSEISDAADIGEPSVSPDDGGDQDDTFLPAETQAPPSDPHADREADTRARMEALEAELSRLRKHLDERAMENARIESERAEFAALYPDRSLQTLPDSVWEDVRRGVPLAAAYALCERKALLLEQKATEVNRDNQTRSVGALNGGENDYFSISEVRAMSASEIRSNYSKIINSMKKWH